MLIVNAASSVKAYILTQYSISASYLNIALVIDKSDVTASLQSAIHHDVVAMLTSSQIIIVMNCDIVS